MVAAALVLPVTDLVRHGSFRRLALRNIGRRKGEALLIVAGSSDGHGDHHGVLRGRRHVQLLDPRHRTHPARTDRRARRRSRTVPRSRSIEASLRRPMLPGRRRGAGCRVDRCRRGVGRAGPARRTERAGWSSTTSPRRGAFGGDPRSTGFGERRSDPGRHATRSSTPTWRRSSTCVAGDRVDVFAYDGQLRLRVRQVVPATRPGRIGRALRRSGHDRSAGRGDHRAREAGQPHAEVLVSNRGGVFSGASATVAVRSATDRALGGRSGVRIETHEA